MQKDKGGDNYQQSYIKSIGEIHPAKAKKLQEQLMKDRKFWGSQPVINKQTAICEGPLDSKNDLEGQRKEPIKLVPDFEWVNINLEDEKELSQFYTLLSENYVEDSGGHFRFDYSRQFLKWCLTPPNYFKEWIVGVRRISTQKLMGAITGIPVHVHLKEQKVKMVEINFLCVHKALRDKRLAPVLIRQITRRVHLRNQWQAIYTSGTILPTPFTQARYYHRSLNPKKLIDIGFSSLSPNMTMSMTVKLYKLPEEPSLPLVPMAKKHVSQVTKLLNEQLSNFSVRFQYNQDQVRHFFLPRPNVVYSFVVENEGKVTDFISFYSLPSHVLKHPKHKSLNLTHISTWRGQCR